MINQTLAVLGAFGVIGLTVAMTLHPTRPRPGKRVPVLVELFTSEGCSDCPPADTLLARLVREQPFQDAVIVPLGEHVDYWDNPKWRDHYSNPIFSARQQAYASTLGTDGPYTPQMVVDGVTGFVGSDEGSAQQAIEHAAQRPKATLDVAASDSPNKISVTIRTETASPAADLYVAVTENALQSQVTGGENNGHHLTHTAVVRTLKNLGPAKPGEINLTLPRSASWKQADLSVIAFVQDRRDRRVLAAGIDSLGDN